MNTTKMPHTDGHTTSIVSTSDYPERPFEYACTCGTYANPRADEQAALEDATSHVNGIRINRKRIDLERRIVRHLIRHLKQKGFSVFCNYDGESWEYPRTEDEALELVFNLDEASLRFAPTKELGEQPPAGAESYAARKAWRKRGHQLAHGVLLVLGNGCDVISDWNYSSDDADGFNAAMDAHAEVGTDGGHYDKWQEEYSKICDEERAERDRKRALAKG